MPWPSGSGSASTADSTTLNSELAALTGSALSMDEDTENGRSGKRDALAPELVLLLGAALMLVLGAELMLLLGADARAGSRAATSRGAGSLLGNADSNGRAGCERAWVGAASGEVDGAVNAESNGDVVGADRGAAAGAGRNDALAGADRDPENGAPNGAVLGEVPGEVLGALGREVTVDGAPTTGAGAPWMESKFGRPPELGTSDVRDVGDMGPRWPAASREPESKPRWNPVGSTDWSGPSDTPALRDSPVEGGTGAGPARSGPPPGCGAGPKPEPDGSRPRSC